MIPRRTQQEARATICPIRSRFCLGAQCAWWDVTDPAAPASRICDDPAALREPPRPATLPRSWVFEACNPIDGDPAQWTEPQHVTDARSRGKCAAVSDS